MYDLGLHQGEYHEDDDQGSDHHLAEDGDTGGLRSLGTGAENQQRCGEASYEQYDEMVSRKPAMSGVFCLCKAELVGEELIDKPPSVLHHFESEPDKRHGKHAQGPVQVVPEGHPALSPVQEDVCEIGEQNHEQTHRPFGEHRHTGEQCGEHEG